MLQRAGFLVLDSCTNGAKLACQLDTLAHVYGRPGHSISSHYSPEHCSNNLWPDCHKNKPKIVLDKVSVSCTNS